jgi:hypothetical protein
MHQVAEIDVPGICRDKAIDVEGGSLCLGGARNEKGEPD